MDDCTRMTQLYLLKHKDKVFDVFHTFHAMIHNQFSIKNISRFFDVIIGESM